MVVNKNIYIFLWFILAMCFSIGHFREVYPGCEMVSGPLTFIVMVPSANGCYKIIYTLYKSEDFVFFNLFLKVIFHIYFVYLFTTLKLLCQ